MILRARKIRGVLYDLDLAARAEPPEERYVADPVAFLFTDRDRALNGTTLESVLAPSGNDSEAHFPDYIEVLCKPVRPSKANLPRAFEGGKS